MSAAKSVPRWRKKQSGKLNRYLSMTDISTVVLEDDVSAESIYHGAVNRSQGDEKLARMKRMTNFESQNFDPVDNDLEEEVKRHRTKQEHNTEEYLKWVFAAITGLAMGCIAWSVDALMNFIIGKKLSMVHDMISADHDAFLKPYLAYIGVSMALAFIAGALVSYIEPLAAGSGIPELKTYLNGVHLPGLLRLKTLLAKAGGISFTIASGMIAGKEGPFVHAGGLVGGGLAGMGSKSLGFDLKYPNQFRNDVDHRDMVAIGTAAGVASAFGAPIGGILFAVEEGASFYSTGIMWRGFLATSLAVVTLQFLYQLEEEPAGLLGARFGTHRDFGLYNDDQAKYSQNFWWYVWEVPIYIAMGWFQGLMGALFVNVNVWITRQRQKYIPVAKPTRRLAEVVFLCWVTVTFLFVASYFSPCRPLPEAITSTTDVFEKVHNATQDEESFEIMVRSELGETLQYGEILNRKQIGDKYFKRWFCPAGHYSTIGQLFILPLTDALKLLVHLGEMLPLSQHMFHFGIWELLTFWVFTYWMMIWTYGAGCAMGLFVPSLAVGAAFGQLVGRLVEWLVAQGGWAVDVNLHTYAVVGAGASLGGTTRMTVSITVLVMETTGSMQLIVPLMLTIFAAKWYGDYYSYGIYDTHIKIRGSPFLEEHKYAGETYTAADKLTISDVMMDGSVVTVQPVMKVKDVIAKLEACNHGAFPVTMMREPEPGQEFELMGTMLRNTILKMLEHRIAFHVPGEPSYHLPFTPQERLDLWHLLDERPYKAIRIENVHEMRITAAEMEQEIDFRHFMQRYPHVVHQDQTLSRSYRLFRTMGLRHLYVTRNLPKVVGLATRKDIVEENASMVLGEKAVLSQANSLNSPSQYDLPFAPRGERRGSQAEAAAALAQEEGSAGYRGEEDAFSASTGDIEMSERLISLRAHSGIGPEVEDMQDALSEARASSYMRTPAPATPNPNVTPALATPSSAAPVPPSAASNVSTVNSSPFTPADAPLIMAGTEAPTPQTHEF